MKTLFPLLLIMGCSSQEIINRPASKTKEVVRDTMVLDASEDVKIVDADEEILDQAAIVSPALCPASMVEINGQWCANLEERCLKWGDPDNKGVNGPVQCLEFQYPTRCLSAHTLSLHYCIDQLPYPYDLEQKPATNMTWYAAQKICQDQGKRLCEIKEFQQACRGPDNKPYPYGYTRQCDLCNCDRVPWLDPATHTFEQVDKRVPIKDIMGCKSDYGVIGLVGNTDRWVHNELHNERPYKSALVGGHPIKGARNRCTPQTLAHYENSQYYEFGQPLCCKSIEVNDTNANHP